LYCETKALTLDLTASGSGPGALTVTADVPVALSVSSRPGTAERTTFERLVCGSPSTVNDASTPAL
jgi:hypothetical protein